MFAQPFVTIMHVFYLVVMGLLSLAGASALVELMIALLHGQPRQIYRPTFEAEDA